jgi:hypothetical protein
MNENHPPPSPPRGEQPSPADREDPATQPGEDPGYLTETGEAAAADGSVVPIIGGLPAAEGSAWDIGAPADERGAALREEPAGHDEPAASDEPAGSDETR